MANFAQKFVYFARTSIGRESFSGQNHRYPNKNLKKDKKSVL